MAPIAMAFGVLELTGSPSAMGLVIAAQSAAQVTYQLLGGALADRTSRKRMLVLSDLLAMTSQFAMALLLLTHTSSVTPLIALMAVNGVAFALHWPSFIGLLPQVVERHELQSANALLSLAQSGSFGLGAALGGILVATVGPGWAIAIDAATFGTSAILVMGLRPRSQQRSARVSLVRDLLEGWKEFTSHRWLWTIVLQFTLVVAASEACYGIVGPIVAQRHLGGPADWGWIVSAFGVGLVVGGLIAFRVRVERPILVGTLCMFPTALPILLLSGPAPLWLIIAGAFINGIGSELFGVLWNTTLQTHVAPEALSRVSAYDILGSIALAPLGMAAAGPLVEAIGTSHTLWIGAALIILPTAAVLAVPEVRTLRTISVDDPPQPSFIEQTRG